MDMWYLIFGVLVIGDKNLKNVLLFALKSLIVFLQT